MQAASSMIAALAVLSACRAEDAAGGGTPAPESGSGAAAGVPEDDWREAASPDGTYRLAWRTPNGEIPKNEEFTLELLLERKGEPASGAALSVRGWMPDHQHGMARQPRVSELGGGRYRVDGMLLHMRGHWQLFFDVTDDFAHTTFAFDLQLP